MIRIIIALLPAFLLMESCSGEEDTDNAALKKNEVILCRVGDADSASLLKSSNPNRSVVSSDTIVVGDGVKYSAVNKKK